MSLLSLPETVSRYETALADLDQAGDQVSHPQVLEVLLARQAVQAALNSQPLVEWRFLLGRVKPTAAPRKPSISRRRLRQRVRQLDRVLSDRMEQLQPIISPADWQIILNPPEPDWIRRVEAPPGTPWWDRFDWLWQGISIAGLTISLSLLTAVSSRFLEGGPDAWGALTIVIPTVLGLLTGGGTLTKTGRQAMEHLLGSLRIAKHWWDEIFCALSLLLMLMLIALWMMLPQISTLYEISGETAYSKGQLATAESHYNRALKIYPNHLDVHYKLGRLYEDLTEANRAMSEYQIAVKAGGEGIAYKAYDRLARLYILNGSKEAYSKAVSLLNTGLTIAQARQDRAVLYGIHTNLGWARLQQERYTEAQDALKRAIQLFGDRASAYCLLAQTQEGLKQADAALKTWEHCLQFANQKDPDQDLWIGMALKRLQTKEATP